MNLYNETIERINDLGKTVVDIDFINFNFGERYFNPDIKTIGFLEFKRICENEYSDYDDGFGGAEVPECYIVFDDGSWLERYEYDGSERWDYKKTPKRIEVK